MQRIDSRELTEWLAYDRISPIGQERGDVQAASVALTVANFNRTRKEPYSLSDFLPHYGEKPEPQTQEQISAALKQWAGMTNQKQRKT